MTKHSNLDPNSDDTLPSTLTILWRQVRVIGPFFAMYSALASLTGLEKLPGRAIIRHFGPLLLIAGVSLLNTVPAQPQTQRSANLGATETQCSALASADFASLQDAPTQITESKLVKTGSDSTGYCQVQGYVTPQVGFEMRIPVSSWNGKFIETGCGGACGFIPIDSCAEALHKGYACIGTDMGHKDEKGGGVWAYNNLQAKIDWGYRATHVTALAGKAITARFYGEPPHKSYFMGCSTGGRQGMVEAQRFPWDFDGIIAGAPASDQSGAIMTRLWTGLAMGTENESRILRPSDLQLVHNAVVAKCDMNDGVKDGLIGDPRICKFDPMELVCEAGTNSGCLSKTQASAVKKIYSGPTGSNGERIYADGGFMAGSELGLEYLYQRHRSGFDVDFLRYMAFIPDPGPNWQVTDLKFDLDYKRVAMMEAIYAGTNPDLRRFKAAGGKLILYHGWADTNIPPLMSVDYYETAEETMGGPSLTQEFFRLFMVPGMKHCGGGDGASEIDYLSYLENWVEQGRAPNVMIGAHLDQDQFNKTHDMNSPDLATEREKFRSDPHNIKFSRPVYPYPARAEYIGHGDPNDAANFRAVEP